MARQTIVLLVDDIDGTGDDATVRFRLDGVAYAIDLSSGHVRELHDALAPFIAAARRVRRGSRSPDYWGYAAPPIRRHSRAEVQAMRAWAREQGISICDRGRLPNSVVDAYVRARRAAAAERLLHAAARG